MLKRAAFASPLQPPLHPSELSVSTPIADGANEDIMAQEEPVVLG